MPRLRHRPNGTVVFHACVTLCQGQDEAVLRLLRGTENLGGLVAQALREFVDRYAGLEPAQRFRVRKDGRLVMHTTLEFLPQRDDPLIRAIADAPPEAVGWTVVELMRSGRLRPAAAAATDPEPEPDLDTRSLALEL